MDLIISRSPSNAVLVHTVPMHRRGLLVGLLSLSLTTKGCLHLEEGCQTFRQSSDANRATALITKRSSTGTYFSYFQQWIKALQHIQYSVVLVAIYLHFSFSPDASYARL